MMLADDFVNGRPHLMFLNDDGVLADEVKQHIPSQDDQEDHGS